MQYSLKSKEHEMKDQRVQLLDVVDVQHKEECGPALSVF